jgi:hypothetical protein
VFLWQVTANAIDWRYNAFCVDVSSVQADPIINKLLIDVNYTYVLRPTLTLGTSPSAFTDQGIAVYVGGGSTTDYFKKDGGTSFYFTAMKQHNTHKMYRSASGGTWTGTVEAMSATQMPRYFANRAVTKIEWTPTALGV